MPVNLNAFLRYKTIDSCLRNQFVSCDIAYLIQKCAEAISNKMGEETSVSERTIRNDIKVLRSDILGFEAPIICSGGVYQYSDSDYSIFNTAIADKELLIDIQNLLLEEYDTIKNDKLTSMIRSLSEITGEKIPDKYGSLFGRIYQKKLFTGKKPTDEEIFQSKLDDYLRALEMERIDFQKKSFMDVFRKRKTNPSEIYKWVFILEGL